MDLSKIKMRTGTGSPESLLSAAELEEFYRRQHQMNFAAGIKEIKATKEIIDNPKSAEARRKFLATLLPPSFNRPVILVLAEHIGFSVSDDIETRSTKFVRLGLALRDVYTDNELSRTLGTHYVVPGLSDLEIAFFVTESFDCALEGLRRIEQGIQKEQAIDYFLSRAQIALWRLSYGRNSLFHGLTDFAMMDEHVVLGARSKAIYSEAVYNLSVVESLLRDESVPLPVIYDQSILNLISTLKDEEKFDLMYMHLDDRDKTLEQAPKNAFDELQKARGFDDKEYNPLDRFHSEEMLQKINDLVEKTEKATKIKLNPAVVLQNYIVRAQTPKLKNVQFAFDQEVLQRYLLKTGKMTREHLASFIHERVQRTRTEIKNLQIDKLIKVVSVPQK